MPTNRQDSGYESIDSGALTEGFSSLDHFNTEIQDLYHPDSSSGRLICAFVQRELRNFHLHDLYGIAYILNEAYLRGQQKIQDGVTIKNPKAWIRSTAYNVIRELSRRKGSHPPLLRCNKTPYFSINLEVRKCPDELC